MAKKTETEVQVAADAKKEAEIAAAESAGVTEKAQPVTENERVMYVGPTVPGIGIQNRVYTEIGCKRSNQGESADWKPVH